MIITICIIEAMRNVLINAHLLPSPFSCATGGVLLRVKTSTEAVASSLVDVLDRRLAQIVECRSSRTMRTPKIITRDDMSTATLKISWFTNLESIEN
jgi:hypothetical protein